MLRGIDLQVNPGEVITVMGPNGAGKTTLLNVCCGLLPSEAGNLFFLGQPFQQNKLEIHRRIGIVSHQLMLYSDLTAEENLHFFARLYGIDQPEKRLDQIFELMNLQKQRKQVVRTLSRGLQQRLTVGRALLHNPLLLFMDEPFTGLDQAAGEHMAEFLKRIVSTQRAILLTTHNFKEAALLASRVHFLNSGMLINSFENNSCSEEDLRQRYTATFQNQD